MPVSQGSGGGLAGMTLKAWGWVRANGAPALLRGFNVASVAAGTQITFTAAMSTTDYVVRQWMSGNSVGVFLTTRNQTTAGFLMEAQNTAGSGVTNGNVYFEVWE